jgi:hypothetical protein
LSAQAGERTVIYVDSGSTDGSVAAARAAGADVVELDMSRPFSAARARNEGFARLRLIQPDVEFVQFVDGDCELVAGWLDRGAVELARRPELAAVCGRLRERFPEASIYNRLCDMEWDGPAGEIAACGGVAMYRAACFREVGGFDETVSAGEEPELCLRLRRNRWKIIRLADAMAMHDAAMTRFGQWWRRARRAGHAYAQGAVMHGGAPERHYVRETRSSWFWGVALPLLATGLAWPTRGVSLVFLLGYLILGRRVYRRVHTGDRSASDARLYACFVVLEKFPQALGQIRFHLRRLRGRPCTIIEHKALAASELRST